MGMTIEDAILCLKGIKQYGSDTFTKRSQGDWQNSLDLAIAIMRKYQQVREIYDNWNVDFGVETHRAMSEIGEVLNGNND